MTEALLDWYDHHRREMPWRAKPGDRMAAYKVWLSEIMLQQTTVATVGPYFVDFVTRWPTVEELARAALDDVLHAWQGLGYYARARNLHKCAQVVADAHGGRFPETVEGLLKLPGIGPYTAAAVASIAFDQPVTPVDGNVERVISRYHRLETPLPALKSEIPAYLAPLTPTARPGDFAQALMDLGATVCTPRNPVCGLCPWRAGCRAFAAGDVTAFPKKAPKKAKPTRLGVAFWIEAPDGRVLLRRRPESGLLGGMMEVPSTPWQEEPLSSNAAARLAPVAAEWSELPGLVRHTFTHFHLELTVWRGRADTPDSDAGVWAAVDALGDYALPTVMKKVVRHALD